MNTINPNSMRPGAYAGDGLGKVPAAAEKHAGPGPCAAGLSIDTAPTSSLDALEEVDPVVEAALTRDDELGGLMRLVFDRPPPPMPEFC